MTIELSKKQKFLKLLFYVLPHHAISRVVYLVTRLRGPQVNPMINWFVKKYAVNMAEAKESETAYYQTFNEFFTRSLKDNLRPLVPGDNTLACPCDGKVSQAGPIRAGAILQAKGRKDRYTLLPERLLESTPRAGRGEASLPAADGPSAAVSRRGPGSHAPAEVHVTIGSIEVTAVHAAPAEAPKRERHGRERRGPMPLEEYLAKREGRTA